MYVLYVGYEKQEEKSGAVLSFYQQFLLCFLSLPVHVELTLLRMGCKFKEVIWSSDAKACVCVCVCACVCVCVRACVRACV